MVRDTYKRLHNPSQGYIQTITQPCLQDRVKQIAGQGYIQTITQPAYKTA